MQATLTCSLLLLYVSIFAPDVHNEPIPPCTSDDKIAEPCIQKSLGRL